MIAVLTPMLEQKCKNSNCNILYSKWLHDKEFLGKMLSNISNIFLHYSIHDESHSQAILNYIIRIVGIKTIEEKFSATDLWMLMQAAYYHDVGMVLFQHDLHEIFSEEESCKKFIQYIQDLQDDESSPLHQDSKKIATKGTDNGQEKLIFKECILDFEILNTLRAILADYFRKKHAERSEAFIERIYDPKSSLLIINGITSLIPQRLFHWLAKICKSHNEDFDKVMDLPETELGMGIEDVHPRLIACLLRIGDLLDLDNNRFDPSAIEAHGKECLPKDTLWHLKKHQSIDRFNVNSKEIEIHATVCLEEISPKENTDADKIKQNQTKSESIDENECIDENAYDIAESIESWFKLIQQEITDQKTNWNFIAPIEYEISLPAIKSLKVNCKKYIYLTEKEKPKFKIDSMQAFELLKGMNLYRTPWQSIREILQNAVDATLIKFWNDYKNKHKLQNDQNYTSEGIKEIWKCKKRIGKSPAIKDNGSSEKSNEEFPSANDYAIKVNIKTKEQKYIITIEDQGIGLSKEDLQYLLKVGSSKKNPHKKKLLDEMPVWLKPSGAFGIGFQSIFMLTKKVFIKTKSYKDEKALAITMFAPNSEHKGDVLIKEIESDYGISPFTCIKFEIEGSKFAINNKNEQFSDESSNIDFDPFSQESDSLDLNCISKHIKTFAQHSPFAIELKINNKKVDYKADQLFVDEPIELSIGAKEEAKKEYVQLSVKMIEKPEEIYSGTTNIYFKNQFVCIYSSGSYPFIDVDFNLLSGEATDWLTIDRNSIKQEKLDYLKTLIEKGLVEYFKIDSVLTEGNELDVAKLSLLYHIFLNKENDKKEKHQTLDRLKDKWRNYSFKIENESITLDTLYTDCEKVSISQKSDESDLKYNGKILKLNIQGADNYFLKAMLVHLLRERLSTLLMQGSDFIMDLSNESRQAEENSVVGKFGLQLDGDELDAIEKYIKQSKHKKQRYLIPCLDKYKILAIDSVDTSLIDILLPFDLDSKCSNLMISPYLTGKTENNEISDSLIEYVYDNRADKNITIENIKSKYKEFINEVFNK